MGSAQPLLIATFGNLLIKHEAYAIELRKKSTNELISQKRAKYSSEILPSVGTGSVDQPEFLPSGTSAVAAAREKLAQAAEVLSKPVESEELLLGIAEFIRKSIRRDSDADQVVKLGLAPKLVELLSHASARIKIEAAWAITNIAAARSENCTILRQLDAPKKLLSLLEAKESTFELKELVQFLRGGKEKANTKKCSVYGLWET